MTQIPPRVDDDFYVQDVSYTSGFVDQQTPTWMAYVTSRAGVVPPDPTGSFVYGDLGCGDGTTLNGLAAIHPEAEFHGFDFNAGHIASARDMAVRSGLTNVTYHEGSFADLGDTDVPGFDLLAMNGIFSWLHPRMIEAVVRFLHDRLRPGGLFYVESMSLPGNLAVAPMWQLMRELTRDVGGSTLDRARVGIERVHRLKDSGAAYFRRFPMGARMIESLRQRMEQDEGILRWVSHALLAENWRPRYATELDLELARADLAFVANTDPRLLDLESALPPEVAEAVRELARPDTIELLKDFGHGLPVRQVVYGRSPERDPHRAEVWAADRIRIMLRGPATGVSMRSSLTDRVSPAGGRSSRDPIDPVPGPVADPALAALLGAIEHGPRSLGELREDPILGPYSDRVPRLFHRLIESGQCFVGVGPGLATLPADPPDRLILALPYNRAMLARTLEEHRPASLLAPAYPGASVRLGLLEARFLDAACSGSRSGWIRGIQRRIRQLTAAPGVPASLEGTLRILDGGEIRQRLGRFEGGKLRNLRRLGMVVPA